VERVTVFPNPVTDGRLVVDLTRSSNESLASIQIMNLQGKTIVSEVVTLLQNSARREYQIADWPEGLYLVRVDLGNNQLVTKKFIKTSK
jgi:Secretion system C-terminal sorting domain